MADWNIDVHTPIYMHGKTVDDDLPPNASAEDIDRWLKRKVDELKDPQLPTRITFEPRSKARKQAIELKYTYLEFVCRPGEELQQTQRRQMTSTRMR